MTEVMHDININIDKYKAKKDVKREPPNQTRNIKQVETLQTEKNAKG